MLEELVADLVDYPTLFMFCCFCGLFYPVPEDVPLLLAGIQVAGGTLEWPATLAATMSGILIRDVLAWSLGRVLGDRLLGSELFQRLIPPAKIELARTTIKERGPIAVLFGRAAIGLRVPTFITAGACQVPLPKFLLWDAVGLCITAPALVALGYAFGPPVMSVADTVLSQSKFVWLAAGVVVAGVVALRWTRAGAALR